MILKNLANIRRKRGLTQVKLAEKSGVTHSSLIKIERGARVDPKISTVIKLAKALNVKMEDLL